MTRREWLESALRGAAVLLLASCGGDGEEEQAPQTERSSRAGTGVETVREPRQLTLAALEHHFFRNPPKASILAREVMEAWTGGSIPGMIEGTTLQLAAIPVKTDENQVIHFTASVVDFLAESAAGGAAAADLVWLPSYADVITLFESGLFAPLDRWLQADARSPLDAFAPEARRLVRLRGQTYALPLAIAPGVLSYNAARFQQANVAPPSRDWTWPEFIEAGKSLTADTNGDGAPDQWGFMANGNIPDWLPFLLQEGGQVIDLDTGAIGMDEPAAIRALTAWDELGRVHGILPYGPDVSDEDLKGWANFQQRGMHFSRFMKYMPIGWENVTPLPQGARRATPLVLEEVLAVPAAAPAESAYEALVPLAHWIGERRVLPAVTAGWQYLEQADTGHFDLIFPKPVQETALQALADGKASHAASSSVMLYHLFQQVTLPLARGEVGVEQAVKQATNWLQSYLAE